MFTGLLHGHGIRIPMDGRGCWKDNVFVRLKSIEICSDQRGQLCSLVESYIQLAELKSITVCT
jgi:hypothetical protein